MSEKKEIWIDVARASACLMVVVLHTISAYIPIFQSKFISTWNVVNLIDSATRMCVPIFFMISGAIFLTGKKIKIKNIARLICCALFYSFFAFLYVYYVNPQDAINRLLIAYTKPVFYHLWFFYSIIIAYFFYSVIRLQDNNKTFNVFIIVTLFTLFNQNFYDSLNTFGLGFKFLPSIKEQVVFLILYGVVGAIIKESGELTKNQLFCVITVLILSVLSIFLLTWYSSSITGRYVSTFYEYQNPLVLFSSSSFMLILININRIPVNLLKFIGVVSSLSLPIYGIHALVLDYLYRFGYRDISRPLIDNVMSFLIAITISMAIGFIIKKIDVKGYVS
ncbi:acyltransferase family protein [Escherichia coli]|nr:acyltransferase family protein [Escherichia coli]